ncbi:hypothetical protein NIES204_18920 [Planktothrix agardhii NIES-204]|nr:hypothetical protein NIES204_18920 [Planktothrix agardhii NIES-204]
MKNFLFSSLISLLSLSQPVWGQTNSLAKNLCPGELEPLTGRQTRLKTRQYKECNDLW